MSIIASLKILQRRQVYGQIKSTRGQPFPKQASNSSVLRQTNIMGANCSCSCFGSAMGAKASKVLPESESLWPSFKGRIKQNSKSQSSKAAAFSNYAVQISPTCLITDKSKAVLRILSISQDGSEFVPVILFPVGKTISDERQPTKTKTQLGFDAAKIQVKFGDEKISVTESRKLGVCGEEEDQVTVKKSNRRSWVRIAKAFRSLKRIKSANLSQLPRPGMNSTSTATNFQPKKMNLSTKRKGRITGDASSEGEGYSMAINLSVLIIIMACLVLFSNRLLAVVCTSIWWYLLPGLLKIYSAL